MVSSINNKFELIMIRVNVLIPAFQLDFSCKNTKTIKNIFEDIFPGLTVSNISWLQSNESECAVFVTGFPLNFNTIRTQIQNSFSLQETVDKMKRDLAVFINKYSQMQGQITKLQMKYKKQEEDISLNFKQEGVKQKSIVNEEKSEINHEAIHKLIRQNINLKNMISYLQAQVEILSETKS